MDNNILDPKLVATPTPPPLERKARKRRTKAQILEELNAKVSLGVATPAERDKLQSMLIAPHQSTTSSAEPSRGIILTSELSRPSSVPGELDAYKKKTDKNPRFEKEDYENLVTYLEIPANFSSIFGSGKKTAITGQSMTRGRALNVFACHINTLYNTRKRGSQATPSNLMHLNGNQLRQRLNKLKSQFSRAKNWAQSTGAGITEADNLKGIFTISQKQEQMRPCFARLDSLFGSKPNVTPLTLFDSGQDPGRFREDFPDDMDNTDKDPPFPETCPSSLGSPNISSANPRSESPAWPNSLLDSPKSIVEKDLPENVVSQVPSSEESAIDKEHSFESQAILRRNSSSASNSFDKADQGTVSSKKKPTRLASRRLEPIPPLHACLIKNKEFKNPLAIALAASTHKKMEVFEKIDEWRQKHEEEKMVRDQARAAATLEWEKEKFHLEQAERMQSRRLELVSRLIEKDKSKDEITEILRLCSG